MVVFVRGRLLFEVFWSASIAHAGVSCDTVVRVLVVAGLGQGERAMDPAVRVKNGGHNTVGHALNRVADELGRGDDERGAQEEDDRGLGVELEHSVVDLVLVEAD